MTLKDIERFAVKYEVSENGCWDWSAGVDKDGYGQFYLCRKMKKSHRVAYELLVGKIPEGLVIDHLCRNRKCVNPRHMEPVTDRINILRGTAFTAINAKKTHCPKMHEYTVENTYTDKNNMRHCRECGRAVMRRLNDRKKGLSIK